MVYDDVTVAYVARISRARGQTSGEALGRPLPASAFPHPPVVDSGFL